MSQDTIDLYREQRKKQVEDGPFSETFQIVGGDTFKGVFDKSHIEENKDAGNVLQKKLYPRILCNIEPSGLDPRVTKIQREDSTEFTYNFTGLDKEGIVLLWLF